MYTCIPFMLSVVLLFTTVFTLFSDEGQPSAPPQPTVENATLEDTGLASYLTNSGYDEARVKEIFSTRRPQVRAESKE